MAKIEVGTKVAYSVQFLRSIGCYSGGMAFARGVVTGFKVLSPGCTLAEVEWDREMPPRVNVANLARVGLNRQFSNVD